MREVGLVIGGDAELAQEADTEDEHEGDGHDGDDLGSVSPVGTRPTRLRRPPDRGSALLAPATTFAATDPGSGPR